MNNPPSHHGCVLVIVGSAMFDRRLVPREDMEHADALIARALREAPAATVH